MKESLKRKNYIVAVNVFLGLKTNCKLILGRHAILEYTDQKKAQ